MMLIDVAAPAAIDPFLDDRSLQERVVALARDERAARADFIVALAEFEERRLHLAAGYSSLFAWLTDHLHFSRASAFRRSSATGLVRRIPAVAAYLREGRLSLTKLGHLRDILQPDNALALLERAAASTEREVEELALQLDPSRITRPPRDSIRPLSVATPPPPSQPDLFTAPPAPSPPTPTPPPAPAPAIRHLIKMTVGAEFIELLDALRGELAHTHPGASLEALLGEAIKLALAARRRRSRADVERPRAPRGRQKGKRSRHVPASIKREIWRRDEQRCTFVSDEGKRCDATGCIQIHHDDAFALGGETSSRNCRLACRAHNDLIARRELGDDKIDRRGR